MCHLARRAILRLFLACATLAIVSVQPAAALDLLNDNIPFSPFNLDLRPYVKLPSGPRNVNSIITRPHDPRLYVTTQEGAVYVVDDDGHGNTTANFWFDAVSSIALSTGRALYGSGGQDGLQSIAFHPGFDDPASPGYGKVYMTLLETRPTNPSGHHYLGNANSGDNSRDSVLVEWTFDHETGEINLDSYRDVFRSRLPAADHMIKQAKFNPYARPADEDYGLLYITHGDSSGQESAQDRPQRFDTISGKMLRIDPLQSETQPYSIPAANPFADSTDPQVLKEIYAYGFRNPHTFSFNSDSQGNMHILVGDIGRANVEEINSVVKGGNYGWPKREGTFVQLQNQDGFANAGYYDGVATLPANEGELGLGYTYPVAQFDHNNNWDGTPINDAYSGMAVASSFVINNGSDPNFENQFIFANFAWADGNVYHTDFDAMLAAKTSLNPGDASTALTQAQLHRLFLALDRDKNPNTSPEYYSEFTHLVNQGRSDVRFGQGVFGEMYISNKFDRTIYLVMNSMPVMGDYNEDRIVDAADYVVWRDTLGQSGYLLPADGNGDGKVDVDDYVVWKSHFGEVWQGANSGGGGIGHSAIPEPSSLPMTSLAIVLGIAAFDLATRRRKHRETKADLL